MITPKRLFDAQQLAVAAGTLYTCPANTRCILKKLTFANTTAGALTVSVYLMKAGATAADDNTLILNHGVGAYDTWECYVAENHIMEAGDFLQALASGATSITAMGSGLEVVS